MWSCLIDSDKANPHGLETQHEGERFRVKLRPDGASDWMTHIGNTIPVDGAVKVTTRSGVGAPLSKVRADCVNWSFVQQFRVHGTPEAVEPKGRYMVSVDGFSLGIDYAWSNAVEEAQRLGAQAEHAKSTIRILQVVATLPPVGERQVVMVGEAA